VAESAVRRKRAFVFFSVLAVAGVLLVSLGGYGYRQLGAAMLLACIVPVGWFIAWFAKGKRRVLQGPLFDPRQPFTPHALVELVLHDVPKRGECRRIFAVGPNGFSTRFIVPAAAQARSPLRVQAQFLRPELALQHLPAGTAFSLVEGQRIVGSGEVIEVLGAR